MFKPNEGKLDRLIRATLADILILSGIFYFSGVFAWICIIVGTVLFFTAITGYCLPYGTLKINTLKYGARIPTWFVWLWSILLAALFFALLFTGVTTN